MTHHYSINGTELHIDRQDRDQGWRIGEPVILEIANCQWQGRVSLTGRFLADGRQLLLARTQCDSGSADKMEQDRMPILLALQDYFGGVAQVAFSS